MASALGLLLHTAEFPVDPDGVKDSICCSFPSKTVKCLIRVTICQTLTLSAAYSWPVILAGYPVLLALEAQSLNHWATREVLQIVLLSPFYRVGNRLKRK